MSQSVAPATPAEAAFQLWPLTMLHFALIGVGIVAALLILWWGARLLRRRHATEAELVERGDAAVAEPPVPEPVAVIDEPVPEQPLPPEPEPAPPPVAAPAPAEPAPVPVAADDLTIMKGIGPRLAERLNSVGVTSFAQIAALTPEAAAELDAKLGDFRGRLASDRWIEQARLLAAGDRAGYEAAFGKLG